MIVFGLSVFAISYILEFYFNGSKNRITLIEFDVTKQTISPMIFIKSTFLPPNRNHSNYNINLLDLDCKISISGNTSFIKTVNLTKDVSIKHLYKSKHAHLFFYNDPVMESTAQVKFTY